MTGLFQQSTITGMIVFFTVVIVALIVDLKAHSEDKSPSIRNATIWSIIWIVISLLFAVFIGYTRGSDSASLFLAGYFLEKSLSVDNLMVFIAVFSYFGVADKYQHRILYYGILGAIVLRMVFIAAGSSLLLIKKTFAELIIITGGYFGVSLADKINVICLAFLVLYILASFLLYRWLRVKFSWFHLCFYVCQIVFVVTTLFLNITIRDIAMVAFGMFVLWSAVKMMAMDDDADEIADYSDTWYVRMTKRIFPVYPQLVGHQFFTRQNGILHITPLFICLVAIEFTDVVFAFDSVPAIISVTQDPFLVYTSNIFAILGLRSMYFMLVAANRFLSKLKYGVIAILAFIGVKMLLDVAGFHISANVSLLVVLSGLTLGVLSSLVFPGEKENLNETKENGNSKE